MFPLHHCLYTLVILLSLPQVICSSSQSSYTPVTALNKYGNSQQLQNARQAAARHGRLIVAARTSSNKVIVVSVYTPKLGQLQSKNGVLQPLWSSDNGTFLACTGIKADATWLLKTARQYSKRLWDRYDVSSASQERTTRALSHTLLEFMGYNRAQEWSDGVPVEQRGKDDDDEPSWARPLGIQTLIISPSFPIVFVEPSGVAQSLDYVAVGKDSDAVMRALGERFPLKDEATEEEIKDMLVEIIRKTIEGVQKQSIDLIVEVASKDGVEVSLVPLQRASRE